VGQFGEEPQRGLCSIAESNAVARSQGFAGFYHNSRILLSAKPRKILPTSAKILARGAA
jgi:hypothetical protein